MELLPGSKDGKQDSREDEGEAQGRRRKLSKTKRKWEAT